MKSTLTRLICFFLVAVPSDAQGIVKTALDPEASVKSILDKARAVANDVINGANSTANGLLLRSANELNVAVANAAIMFQGQQDRAFRNLDASSRPILESIERFTETLEHMQDSAFRLEDLTSLDVENILGTEVPLSHRVFILRRFEGWVQIAGEGDYCLTLTGTNMGFGQSDEEVQVALLLDGRTLPFRKEKLDQHQMAAYIPAKALPIQGDQPTRYSLTIAVKYRTKGALGWKHWQEATFPVALLIMPRRAGTGTITYTVPTREWVNMRTETEVLTTPNHGTDDSHPVHYPYSVTIKVRDGLRLVNARFVPEGGGNVGGQPWSDWNKVVPVYSENGTRVTATVNVWGVPATFLLIADVQEYRVTGSKTVTVPLQYDWGGLLSVDIPAEASTPLFKMQLVTRETTDFLADATDPTGYFRVERIVRDELGVHVYVRLRRPLNAPRPADSLRMAFLPDNASPKTAVPVRASLR